MLINEYKYNRVWYKWYYEGLNFSQNMNQCIFCNISNKCKKIMQNIKKGELIMKRGVTLAVISLGSTFAGYMVQSQTTPEKALIFLLLFTIMLLFIVLGKIFKSFAGHMKNSLYHSTLIEGKMPQPSSTIYTSIIFIFIVLLHLCFK